MSDDDKVGKYDQPDAIDKLRERVRNGDIDAQAVLRNFHGIHERMPAKLPENKDVEQ